jgi:glutamate dehydrogenase
MTDRNTSAHRERIRAVCRSGQALARARKLPVEPAAFLAAYYAQAHDEVLAGDPRSLAAAALGHVEWAARRPPNTAKVRAFNPAPETDGWTSAHTIVETVVDDMPFLVDSLTMALGLLGHGIRATVHPVLQVRRSAAGKLLCVEAAGKDKPGRRESMIHFEIGRETDPQVLQRIERHLGATLGDVQAAVEDWPSMLEQLEDAAREVFECQQIQPEAAEESARFLTWLADNHFTLLGYREYELIRGRHEDQLRPVPETGLGILRDTDKAPERTILKGPSREQARSAEPVLITKTNRKSTVHRPARLDYISVKRFDDKGRPCLERRFLGLFTSSAYSESPRDIPLLRRKVQRILDRSGFDPLSHRGKSLQHVLDNFPRDDLFQGSVADLARISFGVLALEERHKLRLFCRRDTFGRFYSCLVYVPRDQFNPRARRRIEGLLEQGLGGTAEPSQVTLSESALARLQVTVLVDAAAAREPAIEALERELADAVRTWSDRVREALLAALPEEQALALLRRFADSFSAAYQEDAEPKRAARDMLKLAAMIDEGGKLQMALEEAETADAKQLRFTTFHWHEPIRLYRAMPILENMGLKALRERNYRVRLDPTPIWIQDFELAIPPQTELDVERIDGAFQECFARVLHGETESDAFNSFVVTADLDWRQAALLRAYCKYIMQTRLGFSQSYMQEVLARYPALCRALLELFYGRFDPNLSARTRTRKQAHSREILESELERTTSLDDDRILRAFISVFGATLRTNFFQLENGAPKPYLSIKLDPKQIAELPRPRPKFEIFVYSHRVEGVHLRCAAVARGGVRWSDRREDYRTEVLGLMKAQQVKNTVIVPAGAKGGFVCKTLPEGDRDAIQTEVVACYRTFIRGLLDVTDNIAGGEVRRPERVLAGDGDDPYLVVAADKGTASFSDIANEIAAEYGFWLGDAFASGGSAGYDHKDMAITARGAWEAVKRHFREIGVDVRHEEFTAVGIGDMSGDVFGNGMLMSGHFKLIAAFDHRHIFIDPAPDPASSFAERRRLFALPRSSWDDYDKSKLSAGGGVYSRAAKSIALEPAAQQALGITQAKLTPPELIRAILTAPVDLLWNGGIGTYVKARDESHADAGDPANDAVRVDGGQLRCRVVGEGGNLGLTQRGRVEYALAGGRLNTDFIDNSGGVDTSDREVNIKILLRDAIDEHKLAAGKRNALLAEMTGSVAELVLANNYGQTQALSVMASRGPERLGEHARLIRILESRGLVDRALECLPTDEQIEQRGKLGLGLTRPELAVLLSHAKIELSASLADSNIPDDPYSADELLSYFPAPIAKRFKPLIGRHRLAREIIAMLISSSMINRMGPFFALRAEEETGAGVARVARAYAIVRELFGIRRLWRQLEKLDYDVDANAQYESMFQISRMLRRAVYWFLQRKPKRLDIAATIAALEPGVRSVLASLPSLLDGYAETRFAGEAEHYERLGLPRNLAKAIASLAFMPQILDIVEVAGDRDMDVLSVAYLHFSLGRELKLDWVRDKIEELHVEGHWRAMARATLRENLAREQRDLLRSVLRRVGKEAPEAALTKWLHESKRQIARTEHALDEMQATGTMDFATLSVALKEVGRLG